MYYVNAPHIRAARLDDVPELVRLGWATSEVWPAGEILVGELDGVVGAALAVDENRAVTAAVPSAPYLLAHMRVRAGARAAYRRTPDLAERMRHRMRPHVPAAA